MSTYIRVINYGCPIFILCKFLEQNLIYFHLGIAYMDFFI